MSLQKKLAWDLEQSPRGWAAATWKIKLPSRLAPDTRSLPTRPSFAGSFASALCVRHPSPPTTGRAWPRSPGRAKTPYHLRQSCQPGAAKFSFHKTRPPPQVRSQPSGKKQGCQHRQVPSLPSQPT